MSLSSAKPTSVAELCAQQPATGRAGLPAPAEEMRRVLGAAPLRYASERSGGAFALWQHGPLHAVVAPMADDVVMAYRGPVRRLERRSNGAVAIGSGRAGVVTIIPAESSARWDIAGSIEVVQLYLPRSRLRRIADETGTGGGNLVERTGFPDAIASRLLISAAEVIEHNAALDALFRQQLADLLAMRLLVAHGTASAQVRPVRGGLAPHVLRRAIERLRSDDDADLCLGALAAEAGMSRFHFCRAFKESTGLSPMAWLRQRRLEQAMDMLRDGEAVVSVSAALGYASQTAFAAAFKRLTGVSPSEWRRNAR
ncbi:helix-turn-helix transcriptional regulator [Rhodopseudomonas palustris]|uniref:helix-turn-helix transcriptional regulator n=1 Tax=Rhodopseudomonas palustris TaxID=1076 RepID=UPI001F491CB8|nr:AraC family transcriptional regulator [Rhodopseudomonas palustris]